MFLVNFLVELLATEEREIALGVEWPVDVNADASLYLVGCGFDDVICETVQGAEFVVFAVTVSF